MPNWSGEQAPDDPIDSPELLMINALMECPEGFHPERFGVTAEMLSSHKKEWQFCLNHQAAEGHPPSRSVFLHQFPDFEVLAGVKPNWAAEMLRKAHRERTMRREIKGALTLINNGDVELAQDVLRGLVKPQVSDVAQGMNVLDPATVENEKHKVAYPTPWEYLTNLLRGGVGIGEVALVGMRTGQGKSWITPLFAVAGAEAGASCALMTLEMPKLSYIRRVHLQMTRHDRERQLRLRSPDRDTRMEALASLPPMLGRIEVFDPSDIPMNTRSVRRLAVDFDYVFIDYMGLLQDNDGVPAIKDWRVAAEISNECKRIALEERAGLIGAVQINREGESAGFLPPKAHQISGTDAHGQDADILILSRRMGERAMLHDVPKNRGGRLGRFYTAFEPETGSFHELSKDMALDRAREDRDRADEM